MPEPAPSGAALRPSSEFGVRPSPFSTLQAVTALVLALSLIRAWALFTTPLELYPDEAQYWLWSRDLAFGYYSKPPMVAWLIGLTTGIGGDDEPWVRLSSLMLHAGAALALYGVGRRLAGPTVGALAAAFYSLMPGVQLSAGIVSTDAPLLFFLSLALLAYVHLDVRTAAGRRGLWLALGFGAALGGAFLSKYAALYGLIGYGLHALWSAEARLRWTATRLAVAATGFAVIVAPNLVWNALNGFSTVTHTAANADWSAGDLFHPLEVLSFWFEQFGVVGPVPFGLLSLGLVTAAVLAPRGRSIPEADRLLICLTAPPLLLVMGQAFLSRANANWAAAAFASAMVLAALWLWRARAWRWAAVGLGFQAMIAVLFITVAVFPGAAETLGLSNSFKRARGWDDTTQRVVARAEATPGLTAIAVDDRFLFNAMAYYRRDWLARPDAPPLTAWVREPSPQNQAEATDPLTPALGRRVLVASLSPPFRSEIAADFAGFSGWQTQAVPLDRRRTRDLALGTGEGFSPRPRPLPPRD